MLVFFFGSQLALAQPPKEISSIYVLKNGPKECCREIPGMGPVKKFPVDKFEMVLEKEINTEAKINIFKSKDGKNENTIKVIFAKPPQLNGVFLLDASGNTMASITKDLFTQDGDLTFSTCDEVVSGDLNGDHKNDYFVCLTEIGNGIAQSGEGIFFLSNSQGYASKWYEAYTVDSDDLVDLCNDGRCFLIDDNVIWTDNLDLPPKDFSEIPTDIDEAEKEAIKKGETSGIFGNDLFFSVYYPVEVHRDKLVIANNIDKRFPVFQSWFRWEGLENKGETQLISKKQKQKIWEENIKNIMDVPIRDKTFEMPQSN